MTEATLTIGDRFTISAPGYRNRKHVYTVESIRPGDNVGEPDQLAFNCMERTPSGTEIGVLTLPDNTLAYYQAKGWILDAETGKPKR